MHFENIDIGFNRFACDIGLTYV